MKRMVLGCFLLGAALTSFADAPESPEPIVPGAASPDVAPVQWS